MDEDRIVELYCNYLKETIDGNYVSVVSIAVSVFYCISLVLMVTVGSAVDVFMSALSLSSGRSYPPISWMK